MTAKSVFPRWSCTGFGGLRSPDVPSQSFEVTSRIPLPGRPFPQLRLINNLVKSPGHAQVLTAVGSCASRQSESRHWICFTRKPIRSASILCFRRSPTLVVLMMACPTPLSMLKWLCMLSCFLDSGFHHSINIGIPHLLVKSFGFVGIYYGRDNLVSEGIRYGYTIILTYS